MKIRLVKRQTVLDFMQSHSRSRSSFNIWLRMLKGADWKSTDDILNIFGSADFIGNGTDRIIFNIGGNNYRVICTYYFGKRYVHLYINWIGTHSEYSDLCKNNQQYTIENY